MSVPYERVSILVPAFEEEGSVEALIGALRRLGDWKEILVVDDGSTDATAQRARAAGARVVRHPYNKGNGAAVKTAVRQATGDYFVLLDADGQHAPEDIPRLLEKLGEYDLVVGARGFESQASLSRGLGNTALNRVASLLSGFPIPDLTSGFRAAKRDLFREFVHLLPNGFSYPATSTLAFLKAGYNVTFVDIDGQKRAQDSVSKMRPWREGMRFMMIILRMITLFSPLSVIAPVCGLLFALGFGYMVYTIVTEIHVTNTSVLLLVGATVLFFFGLISEQIAALRFETRERDPRRAGRELPALEEVPETLEPAPDVTPETGSLLRDGDR